MLPVLRRLACLVLCVQLLGGCDMPLPAEPLTVGLSPSPGYEYLYYAQEAGIFERAGLNVRLIEYGSLVDARVAFERGQLDGMAGTLVDLLEAHLRTGRVPSAVLVLSASKGRDVVLARPGVSGVADLVGRRVAVEPGAPNVYLLDRALHAAGLGLDDVQLVGMGQSAMAAALAAGQVDAVVTYPPPSTLLRRRVALRPLLDAADVPGEVLDVLAFDSEVLRTRSDEITRLVSLWDVIARQVDDYGDEALAIMAAREHVPLDEFKRAVAGLRRMALAEQADFFEGGRLREATAIVARSVARRHDVDAAQLARCCHDRAWRTPAPAAPFDDAGAS